MGGSLSPACSWGQPAWPSPMAWAAFPRAAEMDKGITGSSLREDLHKRRYLTDWARPSGWSWRPVAAPPAVGPGLSRDASEGTARCHRGPSDPPGRLVVLGRPAGRHGSGAQAVPAGPRAAAPVPQCSSPETAEESREQAVLPVGQVGARARQPSAMWGVTGPHSEWERWCPSSPSRPRVVALCLHGSVHGWGPRPQR